MAQKYKVERVEALREELKDFHSFIFTDYRGLNVQQISELRNNLRDKGARYHVIKNRYAKRVFQDLGFEGMDQYLVNPTAIAYFEENLSAIAKVLIDSSEETTLELKGGYSDGSIISSEELLKISKLPSRDVLLAQLFGMLNAPQRGLVTVLHGIISKFVRTLKAVQDIKPAEEVKAESSVEEAKAEPKAEEVKEEAKAESSVEEAKAEPKAEEAKAEEVKAETKEEAKAESEENKAD
jgi:large subunit ribosomal protein L10